MNANAAAWARRLFPRTEYSRLSEGPLIPFLLTAPRLLSFQSQPAEAQTSAIETPANVVVAKPEELEKVMPISHELGELRRRSLEDRGVLVRYAVTEPSPDPSLRRPADSWLEMTYPFSASQTLREQYQRFNTNLVRLGLVLEDVDGFAGDIAHRHVSDESVRQVTASADKITWFQPPPEGRLCVTRDLRLTGQVSWTGTSSMEVLIEAHTRAHQGDAWSFGGLARFVMVGKDAATGQAAQVARLDPQTKQQHNLYALGHYNREVRKRKRETSLNKVAPTTEEVAMLHAVMKGKDRRAVSMASTCKHSLSLMNSQDRNVSRMMYGGYLLRVAFELAFATAALHAKDFCEPVSMEDVAFLHPVHIGSIVEFTAQVTYVSGPMLRVNVRATTLGKEEVVTNDFTVAFEKPRAAITPVVPHTISEAWLYINGFRQNQTELEERKRLEAAKRLHKVVDREM